MAKVQEIGARHDPVQAAASTPITDDGRDTIKYNVILVVIDDIGREWFPELGIGATYTRDPDFEYCHVPYLSSLAAEGLMFSDHFAEPTCGPTRAALQTGLYANDTGFGVNMRDPSTLLSATYPMYGYILPDSLSFLAEKIKAEKPGIDCAAFGKWHMCDGYSSTVAGLPPVTGPDINLTDYARFGYDQWKGNVYNVGGNYSWWKNSNGVIELISGVSDETTYPTSVNIADATEWLSTRSGQFFCYVAFGPPHSSFTVPPYSLLSAATAANLTALGIPQGTVFDDGVSYATPNFPTVWRAIMEATDEAIRRVVASVPSALRAKTVVIVTGDNGTVAQGLPPGFVHTKRDPQWGGTGAPMWIKAPNVKSPGRLCPQITHVVDIHRTICEYFNVGGGDTGRNESLMPIILDDVEREDKNGIRPYIICQSFRPLGGLDPLAYFNRQRTIYDGAWRLVRQHADVGDPDNKLLYELAADPLEIKDVAPGNTDQVLRLDALLDEVIPL